MSVVKHERKQSKVEFDAVYFKMYSDAVRLVEHHFGAKGEVLESKRLYISIMSSKILNAVNDIGTYIRIANSIYPKYEAELKERRKLKKYKKKYDDGIISAEEIRNNYKSWRGCITKDSNACAKTIR